MKTLSSYKQFAKHTLFEAEEFKARSKKSGKIVYYKTKDAMKAAIKDKKAEPIEKGDKEKGKDKGKPTEPKGAALFKDKEKPEKPSGEPEGEESKDEKKAKKVVAKKTPAKKVAKIAFEKFIIFSPLNYEKLLVV